MYRLFFPDYPRCRVWYSHGFVFRVSPCSSSNDHAGLFLFFSSGLHYAGVPPKTFRGTEDTNLSFCAGLAAVCVHQNLCECTISVLYLYQSICVVIMMRERIDGRTLSLLISPFDSLGHQADLYSGAIFLTQAMPELNLYVAVIILLGVSAIFTIGGEGVR